MSWKTQNTMSLREEFVQQATIDGANVREVCRRFGISPTTGYKWLSRFLDGGLEALADRSRRPKRCPHQVSNSIEKAVIALRHKHPTWGARKLRRRLQNKGQKNLPAISTISAILGRHGLLRSPRPQRDLQRFERSKPNELWQIDFKGHFITDEGDCHPFTSLDDHSRYCLGITACAHEDGQTVKPLLEQLFRVYGMPDTILCDNGNPWGSPSDRCPVTPLGIWLWRLGIDVLHGRPFHPQTQGKLERFHRTLKADVIARPRWKGHRQCQKAFDRWRPIYNTERPHEALGDATPDSRYSVSTRHFPNKLKPIEYDQGVITRRVSQGGAMSFDNQFYYVGRGFVGHDIGLIETIKEGIYEVRFGWKVIGEIDASEKAPSATQTISVWTNYNETMKGARKKRWAREASAFKGKIKTT